MASINLALTRYMNQCEPLTRRLAIAYWNNNPEEIHRVEHELRILRDNMAEDDLHPDTLLITLERIPLKVLNHLEKKRVTRVRHLLRQDWTSLMNCRGIGVGATRKLLKLRDELKTRLEALK